MHCTYIIHFNIFFVSQSIFYYIILSDFKLIKDRILYKMQMFKRI